jgi:hydrogenase expression/formation protein HypD
MRLVDEFRNPQLLEKVRQQLPGADAPPAVLMEVCGTHTMAIARYGLRSLLPKQVRLVSGPGCPVCVTHQRDIDICLALASVPNVTIATFGDMMRVPGTHSSLEQQRASGSDVRMVYSPMDAVRLAEAHPNREVVFLGVGFETTAPAVAASILEASRIGLRNFSVYCAHKLIPPALEALAQAPELQIDGFILPGHVSTILGLEPYRFLAEKYGKACVVTGFEPLDIAIGMAMLLERIKNQNPGLDIQYTRVVRPTATQQQEKPCTEYSNPSIRIGAALEPYQTAAWQSEASLHIWMQSSNLQTEYRNPIPQNQRFVCAAVYCAAPPCQQTASSSAQHAPRPPQWGRAWCQAREPAPLFTGTCDE